MEWYAYAVIAVLTWAGYIEMVQLVLYLTGRDTATRLAMLESKNATTQLHVTRLREKLAQIVINEEQLPVINIRIPQDPANEQPPPVTHFSAHSLA